MLCISPLSRIFCVCHDTLDLEMFDSLKTPSSIMSSKKKVKLPPPGLYRPTDVHTFVFADLGLCVCVCVCVCVCLHSCSPAVYTCLSLKGLCS